MDRADLLAFARRDWSLIANAKTGFWQHRKRDRPPGDIISFADGLRRYALAVRPDWPSEADRAADLAVHLRVTEALRAVSSRSR